MKTREQCIEQIYAVADSWGAKRPKITASVQTEALRKICANLDREGEKMGAGQ